MFSLLALMSVITMVIMIVALFRIKQTIGRTTNGKANTKRMISHASAFIVALSVFIFEKSLSGKFYYLTWFIVDFFMSLSNYFLFVLLWHLGTKEDYKRMNLTPSIKKKDTLDLAPSQNDFLNSSSKLNKQVWLTLLESTDNPTSVTDQLL